MENREQDIIFVAARLFKANGFKKVTMDHIASEMSMSKKTLYKFFKNKKELISRIIRLFVHEEKCNFQEFVESASDAIDEMVKLIRHVVQMFEDVDISDYADLKKYYPASWNDMDSFLSEHIYLRISGNVERGIKEGLYRQDLNADIIAKLYVAKVHGLMEEKLFPKKEYDKRVLMRMMIEYHIRGIVNNKGLELLNEYNEKSN